MLAGMVLAASAAAAANLRQYAVVVMDANTGQVMHSRAADATRYPASIAKVMTLYILFEELEAGRFSLNSPLSVSRHAAAAEPTKLGLQPGQTIKVEDAILALVTQSANDAARVIAENIEGTETAFARRMTRTAEALGMSRTTYKNASGLPDSGQVTTVRDQARLGMAIYQHFPEYYHYFQTRSFRYRGHTYGNHNRLLGANGVDGIKTGYIRSSGFNLLTAAHNNDRHVVIAAFGFESGSSRDAKVRELVQRYLPDARRGETWAQAMIPKPSGGLRGQANPVQVALSGTPPPRPAHLAPEQPATATATATAAATPGADILLASFNPPAPQPPGRPQLDVAPTAPPARSDADQPLALMPVDTQQPQRQTFAPANVLGNFIAQVFGGDPPSADPAPQGFTPPAAIGDPTITGSTGASIAPAAAADAWTVQVGAAPSEAGAIQLLTQAGANLAELSDYRSYVQPITRDGQALYRARFVGFANRSDASAMCEALKQKQISCLAMPG